MKPLYNDDGILTEESLAKFNEILPLVYALVIKLFQKEFGYMTPVEMRHAMQELAWFLFLRLKSNLLEDIKTKKVEIKQAPV